MAYDCGGKAILYCWAGNISGLERVGVSRQNKTYGAAFFCSLEILGF